MSIRSMNARSLGVDHRAREEPLIEPVGEPARVEAILQAARAGVVGRAHCAELSEVGQLGPRTSSRL